MDLICPGSCPPTWDRWTAFWVKPRKLCPYGQIAIAIMEILTAALCQASFCGLLLNTFLSKIQAKQNLYLK